jgi:hypothetical protein
MHIEINVNSHINTYIYICIYGINKLCVNILYQEYFKLVLFLLLFDTQIEEILSNKTNGK